MKCFNTLTGIRRFRHLEMVLKLHKSQRLFQYPYGHSEIPTVRKVPEGDVPHQGFNTLTDIRRFRHLTCEKQFFRLLLQFQYPYGHSEIPTPLFEMSRVPHFTPLCRPKYGLLAPPGPIITARSIGTRPTLRRLAYPPLHFGPKIAFLAGGVRIRHKVKHRCTHTPPHPQRTVILAHFRFSRKSARPNFGAGLCRAGPHPLPPLPKLGERG